jgi:hypothetical protein
VQVGENEKSGAIEVLADAPFIAANLVIEACEQARNKVEFMIAALDWKKLICFDTPAAKS